MSKSYVKVPIMLQMESYECGAVCLNMILSYFGKYISSDEIRNSCNISTNGSNAKTIFLTAEKYGLKCRGLSLGIDALKTIKPPAIIHWNFQHFVVFCGFNKNKAVINDPASGVKKVDIEKFRKSFTGVCLTFEKGENFKPSKSKVNINSIIKFQSIKLVIFPILSGIILALLNISSPEISKGITDNILYNDNKHFLSIAIFLLCIFSVITFILSVTNKVNSLKVSSKISVSASCNFLWHLLHLPIEFFERRRTGDLSARFNHNERAMPAIVTNLTDICIGLLMTILYLVIMFNKSVILSIVALVGFLLYFLCTYINIKINRENAELKLRNQNKLSAETSEIINGIESIKSSGAENECFEKWSGIFAELYSSINKYVKIKNIESLLLDSIITITNIFILVLGSYMALTSDFTAGTLLAFQGYVQLFFSPALTAVNAKENISEIISEHKAIDDILSYPAEENIADNNIEYAKLLGNIELKNVTFGYTKMDKPIIENLSLSIKAGENIAIVGSSGCGKSTLSKLITGLIKPWDGYIYIDGKNINSIPKEILSASIGVVDQNITLYNGTISDNIKMWDYTIEDFDVILAARDANIHKEITEKAMGYEAILSENGKNLSGGQQQRIEIARVLATDPTILIFDEATSRLDSNTEKRIFEAVKKRGITIISVSHRTSAIKHCDKIIVMDKGKIVECGTHNELIANNGLYSKLISLDWRNKNEPN